MAQIQALLDSQEMRFRDMMSQSRPGPPGPPGPSGPPGPITTAGQTSRVDTSWKPADIGYFDPGLPDINGSQIINNTTYYTNTEVFLDRMRDLASLKSPGIVRAQIHSCLKGAALRWYTSELSRDAKELLQLQPLEEGRFKRLAARFKTSRIEALRQLESTRYTWREVRAGHTPQEYAQTMLRLLKATGTTNAYDQILKIVFNIDATLARDIGEITEDATLDQFMTKLDFHYENWKRQAEERRSLDAKRETWNPRNQQRANANRTASQPQGWPPMTGNQGQGFPTS